jgi:hypothetical protein
MNITQPDQQLDPTPTPPPPPPAKRRILRWILISVAIIFLLGPVVGLILLQRWVNNNSKDWVERSVAKRFKSDVQLSSLSITLFPRPSASGTGMSVRHHGRTDVPPLIAIERFEAKAGWMGIFRKHIDSVDLQGLKITVPPKRDRSKSEKDAGKSERKRDDKPAVPMPHIDRVTAHGALLTIVPKKAGKDPLVFELHKLNIEDVDPHDPMRYDAQLTNAKPPGLIDSKGHFGPWNADEPGDTPLGGDYTFNNADLSDFKGISGILSAKGAFRGALNHIETEGTTVTPDFALDISGQPMYLKTEYKAVVDGTDGDTYLNPVRAQLGNTIFVAKGAVEGLPGRNGKGVRLDVYTERARIEDILRLAVKSPKPLMTGGMSFTTKFYLPPGPRDVVEKLQLDGRFGLAKTKFTGETIQDKIDTLSRKGQGQPKNAEIDNVAANFRGNFRLRDGELALSNLNFHVDGAEVALNGSYLLRAKEMNFQGKLMLDAPISKTTTGIKSVLLKAVDPLFGKRGGGKGSEVAIKISGTPTAPKFGLDLGKTLRRN